MSACLLRYSMCFVFVADYRKMLEDRKEQPLTLCAGQAVICRAWSVCTQRENEPVARRTLRTDARVFTSISRWACNRCSFHSYRTIGSSDQIRLVVLSCAS